MLILPIKKSKLRGVLCDVASPFDDKYNMTENNQSGQESDNTLEKLEALRNQAAKYRVTRNDALKKLFVAQKVLKAHNITFDLEDADTGGLLIENGVVNGEFDYQPPKPERAEPKPLETEAKAGMTIDDIKEMTPDQINKNWEEVSKILEEN